MTDRTRWEVRQREIRSRLSELAAETGDLSDEQRGEITKLTAESRDLDAKLNALALSEGGTERRDSQLTELESRANLGRVFDAVLEHRTTDGAEAELQQETGLAPNQVPLALFARAGLEERAVTAAPTNVGANQQSIIPDVFPMSAARFLGIDMPTVPTGEAVFPVLTTSATVHTPAENASAAETTGAFSADVLSPSRLQASFFYSREDRARFSNMDTALRENLSMALSDGLGRQILVGTNGLLTGTNLASHAASAATTFSGYVTELAAARVDGTFASGVGDVRILMGSATYAHAYQQLAGSGGNLDSFSAAEKLERISGGVRVSAHVPAVASDKQNALARLGMRRDAVAPIWEGITLIPDELTLADKGQVKITAVMLHAVKILRASGFHKQETQHA